MFRDGEGKRPRAGDVTTECLDRVGGRQIEAGEDCGRFLLEGAGKAGRDDRGGVAGFGVGIHREITVKGCRTGRGRIGLKTAIVAILSLC